MSLNCKHCSTTYQLKDYKDHKSCYKARKRKKPFSQLEDRTQVKHLHSIKEKIQELSQDLQVTELYLIAKLGILESRKESKKTLKELYMSALEMAEFGEVENMKKLSGVEAASFRKYVDLSVGKNIIYQSFPCD